MNDYTATIRREIEDDDGHSFVFDVRATISSPVPASYNALHGWNPPEGGCVEDYSTRVVSVDGVPAEQMEPVEVIRAMLQIERRFINLDEMYREVAEEADDRREAALEAWADATREQREERRMMEGE